MLHVSGHWLCCWVPCTRHPKHVKIAHHGFFFFFFIFLCHIWKLIHGPLGKVRTIIRPFSLDISAIGCMKVSNSFVLIDPWWFYCKAVNLCTGEPQPPGSLCWHLQQWLECHCFPILHCHSGSTRSAFYLILQWNTHSLAHTLAFPFEQHRPLKLDLFWTSTSVSFCFSVQYNSLVCHTNGYKAKPLTLHIIVDPKGKMSVGMENSENKEIVPTCVHARTNIHPCQSSQVFEHEIVQAQLPSHHLLNISTQKFNRSQDQCT